MAKTTGESDWVRRIRAFQEALHPRQSSRTAYCDVEAAFRAPGRAQLLGDYCDCLTVGDLDAFAIGDVTGHGLPSALVVGVLHGAIREALRFTASPCRILTHAHDLLAAMGERAGGPRVFSASLAIGLLDSNGVFTYANAGHPSPLLVRDRARAEPLEPTTPPIGLVQPSPCAEHSVRLAPGNRLLFYTDGILPHGAGPDDVQAEVDRLGDIGSDALCRHLVNDGVADDRTVMVATFRGLR